MLLETGSARADENGSTRGRAPGELILDKLSGQEAFEKISLPPLAAAVVAAATILH